MLRGRWKTKALNQQLKSRTVGCAADDDLVQKLVKRCDMNPAGAATKEITSWYQNFNFKSLTQEELEECSSSSKGENHPRAGDEERNHEHHVLLCCSAHRVTIGAAANLRRTTQRCIHTWLVWLYEAFTLLPLKAPLRGPARFALAFHLLQVTWESPVWPVNRFLCIPASRAPVSPVCNSAEPSVARVTLRWLNLNGNWMNCLEVIQPSRTINPYYWQALKEQCDFEWEWGGKLVLFSATANK